MVATALAACVQGAGAATASSVVGAYVASATYVSIDPTDAPDPAGACLPETAGITQFGAVVAGSSVVTTSDCTIVFGSSNDTAALRVYQDDGSGGAMWSQLPMLDTTWAGGDGVSTITDVGAAESSVSGMSSLLDAAERSYVPVQTNVLGTADFAVVRYDASGSIDTSYGGGDGISQIVNVGATEVAWAAAVLPDGSTYVSGYTTVSDAGDVVVVKYTPTGTIDPTWGGGDGISQLGNIPGRQDLARKLLPTPDGGLMVAATSGVGGVDDYVALRYDAAGALDTSYGGGDGITVRVNFVGDDEAHTGALLPDGSVLVAGTSFDLSDSAVVKFDAAGELDLSWGGGDGAMSYSAGASDRAYALLPRPDGTVYVIGTGSSNVYTARITAAGVLDPSFGGGDGLAPLINIGGAESVAGAILQQDGTLIVTGQAVIGGSFDGYVMRLDPAGTPDASWAAGGVAQSLNLGATESISSVEQSIDGTLVVTGQTDVGGTTDVVVARYASDVIPNHAAGSVDWDSAAPDDASFGVCLRSVSAGAAVDAGTWNTTGSCSASATDPWRGVPTGIAGSKVAFSSSVGDGDAAAHLRFGLRTASDQPPRTYIAPLVVEVIAPNG